MAAVTPVLAQNDIQTTGAYQELYEVSAGKVFHGQLSILALNASGATVKVAFKTSASPTTAANGFKIHTLTQNQTFQLTNLVLNAGVKIFVETDTADVTPTVIGFEE